MVAAAALASLSLCVRPTMIAFWACLHVAQSTFEWQQNGLVGVLDLLGKTLLGG